jgi:hypothetical protein
MKRRHVPLLLLVVLVALFAAPAAGQEPLPLPQCSDLADNDTDGAIDLLDPGCSNADDNDESDDPPPPPPPPDPPTVTLTVPSGVLSSSTSYPLSAAVTPGAPPYSVSFYDASCGSGDSGNLIDVDATAPYTASWLTPNIDGSRTLSAVVTDDLGRTDCDSAAVTIDAGAPSPPILSLSASGSGTHLSGSTVYVNPAGTGSYRVTAATDPDVTKVYFPERIDPSAPFVQSYVPDDLPEGLKSVIAEDGAENKSEAAEFSVVVDTTGPDPIAGFVNYPDGNVAVPGGGPVSIAVSWAPGQDIDSGLQPGSGILERQAVALVGTTCDFTVATWVEVTRSGVAGSLNESIAVGKCARYRYRISDNVGNETIYAALFVARNDPGDITPPRSVRRARITTGDHRVVLTYRLPTVDFSRVKIYRWISGKKVETRGLLYKGTRSRKVDSGLFNRTRYVYQIVTCDRRDNCGLPGVILSGTPRSRYLISPRDGAILSRPPLLDWRAHPRASFYNLKLVRNGRTVLSRFPRRTEFKVRSTWKYKGVTRRYRDGTYFWYVWPRIGGRYGALMGWSRFSRV